MPTTSRVPPYIIDLDAEPAEIFHVKLDAATRSYALQALTFLEHPSAESWPFERPGFAIHARGGHAGGFLVDVFDAFGKPHAFRTTRQPLLDWLQSLHRASAAA
jgi:hypothetical protein